MADLLHQLAAYVPPSLVRETVTALAPTPPSEAHETRLAAAILFADVSGFTPLTEALAQKGAEGPEELTRLLNDYFSRMIALIEAEGGEVVKFSGDALTVVFPAVEEDLGQATRRAHQAAEAMQAAMSQFASLPTSVGPVALGMKIGLGAGEIRAAQIGGMLNHWEYVIAGDPLRQVAEAEHRAQRGDIILSPEAEAVIVPHPLPPRPLLQPDWAQVAQPAAVEAVLRCYVPGAISVWLEENLQEWLAVLRPMSVLFMSVSGLDYGQAKAINQLHAFLRATQEIVYRYEGSINKLAVDDKGTVAIALFGAPPRSHEDDPERAVRCALALQVMAEQHGLQLATGLTTGRVFAGPVGSQGRREYTVMGDTVNLAARLMAAAGPGQLRSDYETYRLSRQRLGFETLPSVRLKGKAGLVRLYRPLGEAGQVEESRERGALIGRQAELARLEAHLTDIQQGRNRILLIEGEAGIGKSRLTQELIRLMRERGLSGLVGAGRSIEQQTPYRAWRDIFSAYFGLDEIQGAEQRQQLVQAQVNDILPHLLERLPLLNDVLNLGLPETQLTASLDTHLRHESLVSLLLTLLLAWTAERPLVLIIEDAHWLDSLSWDLTLQTARALDVAHAPLLLVLVMRPLSGELSRVEPVALSKMDETERLLLEAMSPEETVTLAAARLGLSAAGLPPEVADLVRRRAGGNPFFAEELVYTLRDNNHIILETESGHPTCRISSDLSAVTFTLPDTIQGLILSRIDHLPPEAQLALKVAAVIGRTFGYSILSDTLSQHMEIGERLLRLYLDDLSHREFTPLDVPEPELTYVFKHIITQEVAYETLLFAQRRQLHRSVGQWFEHNFDPDGAITSAITAGQLPGQALNSPLAPYFPLLVYHWHQAEDDTHERIYAWLAGQWAAAQFANIEAVGYFTRALELTSASDLAARYDLLLAREAVNDLRGEREAQARDLDTLDSLVEQLNDDRRRAEVALRRANYAEVISDYPTALAAAQQATQLSASIQDRTHEVEGYIAWGKTLWRQGNYQAARISLEQALKVAQDTANHNAEAKSLYYLGDVALYQNDYPAAQSHYQAALDIYRLAKHRQGEADSLSNLGVINYDLGNYLAARDYYNQALLIYQTMGDRRGETIILGNLGALHADLGDYETARHEHQQALDLRVVIGDRWGEALSLTNLGLVYYGLGNYGAAQNHCQRALEIQREIGDRRNQGFSLTYLGHALTEVGELPAAASAYTEALNLRRDLGQAGLAMDNLAGLAQVALAQDNLTTALKQVEEILAWTEAHGIAGIEYPLQVYFTCYQVLTTGGNGTAQTILARAYTLLQERAANITDPTLQHGFLENITTHHKIVTLWQANQTS